MVLDIATELPVLAALLPSRRQWACRWLGAQLCLLKYVPQIIITDGLPAYASMVPGAQHVLCRFYHRQGVTHWLTQHFATAAEINVRKPGMKQVFQTRDKHTVRRRLAQLKEQASALGILTWVTALEAKLPKLICSVGSGRLSSSTNAIERFFWAFQRFYTTRGGFHSVLSAKRELILFVVYLFTQHATTGQAPIEVDGPRGTPNAPVPPDQRSIQSTPGARPCQVTGQHGRFVSGQSRRSLDVTWGEYATLSLYAIPDQPIFT